MPRRVRLNLPEVPLHIVQRGNNRQPTLFADDDYAFYLECLRDSALQHACDEPETGLRLHLITRKRGGGAVGDMQTSFVGSVTFWIPL